MSDLIKLNNIVERNGDIKAFTLCSNMMDFGKNKTSWGYVKIAIDRDSVNRIMSDDLIGVLYVVSREEWEKENTPIK